MTQNALQLAADGYGPAPHMPANASLRRVQRVAAGVAPEQGAAALANAIDRLQEAVQQETAALRRRGQVDLKDFNTRKSHGLLELTRAMRQIEPGGLTDPLRERLVHLRTLLDVNRAAIAVHLEAVREIATMMADAAHEAESDGTYSVAIAGVGSRP